jgi:hypothetical protein
MMAQMPAARTSGIGEMRVCAVVIAHPQCMVLIPPVKFSPYLFNSVKNRRTPLTWRRRAFNLGSSMLRTPNATKSIFAFAARVSLR